MATRQDIRAKLDEYDAAAEVRELKFVKRQSDRLAVADAIVRQDAELRVLDAEAVLSEQEYRAAAATEAEIEDQLEALTKEHEPPAVAE